MKYSFSIRGLFSPLTDLVKINSFLCRCAFCPDYQQLRPTFTFLLAFALHSANIYKHSNVSLILQLLGNSRSKLVRSYSFIFLLLMNMNRNPAFGVINNSITCWWHYQHLLSHAACLWQGTAWSSFHLVLSVVGILCDHFIDNKTKTLKLNILPKILVKGRIQIRILCF